MTPHATGAALHMTASTAFELLRTLNGELERGDTDVELCVAGGAVMALVFAADPGTRRPSAMFGSPSALTAAIQRVGDFEGASPGWMKEAVRAVTKSGDETTPMVELSNLRVYAARPDYVFAMKCASLATMTEVEVADALEDVRFLLRVLDIADADQAMSALAPYFTTRQLPVALRDTLAGLLA